MNWPKDGLQKFILQYITSCVSQHLYHHVAAASRLQSHSAVIVAVSGLVALAIVIDKAYVEEGIEDTTQWRRNQHVHLLCVVNTSEDNRWKVNWGLERQRQETGMISHRETAIWCFALRQQQGHGLIKYVWTCSQQWTSAMSCLLALDKHHIVQEIAFCGAVVCKLEFI